MLSYYERQLIQLAAGFEHGGATGGTIAAPLFDMTDTHPTAALLSPEQGTGFPCSGDNREKIFPVISSSFPVNSNSIAGVSNSENHSTI